MKRFLIGAISVLTLLLILRSVFREKSPEFTDNQTNATESTSQLPGMPESFNNNNQTTVLPIALEAARLNAADHTAQDDIEIIAELLREYRRHYAGNPVGDNEEITAALLGRNPKRLACLPAGPGAWLDSAGRLLDRWGTPYFFHALSGNELEIISAGPDRSLFTADDLRGGF